MKILCAILLFAYSTAAFPRDSRPLPPPPAPTHESHDSKLVPFLIGAALGAFLMFTLGKEPDKEPVLKIKSQSGDDR